MCGGVEGFEILLDLCRFSSGTILYLELALRQPVSFCGFFFSCFSGRRKGLQFSGLVGEATQRAAASHTIESRKFLSTAGPEGRLYQLFGWGLFFFFKKKRVLFLLVCMCVFLCRFVHISAISKETRRGSYSPELQLHVIVNHVIWVLGTGF